jgi:hypothetical protein
LAGVIFFVVAVCLQEDIPPLAVLNAAFLHLLAVTTGFLPSSSLLPNKVTFFPTKTTGNNRAAPSPPPSKLGKATTKYVHVLFCTTSYYIQLLLHINIYVILQEEEEAQCILSLCRPTTNSFIRA